LSHVPAGFLPDLLFNPEDGSYIFLWCVGIFPSYTALESKSSQSELKQLKNNVKIVLSYYASCCVSFKK
jgi:hypothetical protein